MFMFNVQPPPRIPHFLPPRLARLPFPLKSPLVSPNPTAEDTRVAHPHRLELSRQQRTRPIASRALAREPIKPDL